MVTVLRKVMVVAMVNGCGGGWARHYYDGDDVMAMPERARFGRGPRPGDRACRSEILGRRRRRRRVERTPQRKAIVWAARAQVAASRYSKSGVICGFVGGAAREPCVTR